MTCRIVDAYPNFAPRELKVKVANLFRWDTLPKTRRDLRGMQLSRATADPSCSLTSLPTSLLRVEAKPCHCLGDRGDVAGHRFLSSHEWGTALLTMRTRVFRA